MLKNSKNVTSNSSILNSEQFLIQVVHLYYQRKFTQQQIAHQFNTSKMTISRALQRAEEIGLIEVRVNLPINNIQSLEGVLEENFDSIKFFVVENHTDDDFSDEQTRLDFLGQATALYIDPQLKDSMIIAIAFGRTIARAVHHIPQRILRDVRVVQLMGGLYTASSQNPYNLIPLLSERIGAKGAYFFGPALVANEETQVAMREENMRSGLSELWLRAELCLSGIGSLTGAGNKSSNPYINAGLMSSEEETELLNKGAVGDLFGYYFDIAGNWVKTAVRERVNSIPLEDVLKLQGLVVTAGGGDKVQSIIGVARLGIPMTIVTDKYTAEQVLTTLKQS